MASVAPEMLQNVGSECPSDNGAAVDSCVSFGFAALDSGLKAVQHEGTLFAASLRANSSIPYSVIPNKIDSVNQISNCIITACQTEAVNCFAGSVSEFDGDDLVSNFQRKLSNSLNQLRTPLSFLQTQV